MKALKNSLIRAQNIFSTMQPFASLQTQNSPPRRIRQLRLRARSFKGMVPEKIFNSLFMSPFFNYAPKV
jgi:hypothetical protein